MQEMVMTEGGPVDHASLELVVEIWDSGGMSARI